MRKLRLILMIALVIVSSAILISCKSLKNFTKEDAYNLSLKRYKEDFKIISVSQLIVGDKNDLLYTKKDLENKLYTIENINGLHENPYVFNNNVLTLPSGEERRISFEEFKLKYLNIKENDLLLDNIGIDDYSYEIEKYNLSKGSKNYFAIVSTYQVDNLIYNFSFLGTEYSIIVNSISFKYQKSTSFDGITIYAVLENDQSTQVRLSLTKTVFGSNASLI